MMYSEFVAGTGCRDNEHNYKVFQNLEAMYMNTEMSKQEVYEYGKKLVDNSKSEAELKLEAEIKSRIDELKAEIEWEKRDIEWRKELLQFCKDSGDKEGAAGYQRLIKRCRERIKECKNEIAACKWVLGC